ncbi:MAG TPA: D-alanine--D-alanine ligase [Myxococcales bacterium]|nr:D-alanine--D-alanine ligase [Myxococcales bacterium]
MAAKKLVAVLLGGPSSEHDVSLATGSLVLERLDRARFDGVPVYVDRQRVWHFPKLPHPPAQSWRDALPAATPWQADGSPMPWRPDVCFLGLHGAYGEDGQVQDILERASVPYTGSGPAASRLAMNKRAAKDVFRRKGLPVAPEVEIAMGEAPAAATGRVRQKIEGPWVVKPRDGGSSVGVVMVGDPAALEAAITAGLAEPLLVEPRLAGREMTCGVLEELATRRPRSLPVTEIRPKGGAFFDYKAKYTAGQSEEITPADIPTAARDEIQRVALAAHEALGCRAYSRSDFILQPDGKPILLETNTLPGLTATSLLPQEAAAVGIDYPSLLSLLIDLALPR